MVKLYVLDSVDKWRDVRTLRNSAVHDYSASEEDKALHYPRLLQNTDFLFDVFAAIKKFANAAYSTQ